MECNKFDFIVMQFSMYDFSFFVHERKYFLTRPFLHYKLLLFTVILLAGCNPQQDTHLFTALTASETGIDFVNHIEETAENNITTYEYFYNGAGLTAGDINNDGLPDLYAGANYNPNKLYLNKGSWKFEDITKESGCIDRSGDWKTGITMADVNGDGWLDIYLCYAGNSPGEGFNKPVIKDNKHRANQLFINQGCKPGEIPTFKESAAFYGLDAPGTFSTQAYFFDFDRDGDLDMFLLNHANTFYATFFNTSKLRNSRHPYFGNKLYRNDNNKFVEISDKAGIYGSGKNFGLGAAISDFNNDGWPDIYVTNDYDEQDYFYLNNMHGGFTEISHKAFGHISKFGMGADAADINNDMQTDIFVADMLPEDNYRQKLLLGPDQYDKYTRAVDSGYHHQNMRNTLQLNAGNGPDGIPLFREIGQLKNVSNTDWSWSPLFADLDNDGWKDLIVANGYLRDFTNMDFLKYFSSKTAGTRPSPENILSLIKEMPSTKLYPYVFCNKKGEQFENVATSWGFNQKSVSNSMVYADFDNDGDLDIVMNRINDEIGVYKNQSEKRDTPNNFLKIKLNGSGKNKWGIGSKLWLTTDSFTIYQEAFFGRGYEASVEPVFTIGIGRQTIVKEVKVQWPDGKFSVQKNIPAKQSITIDQSASVSGPENKLPSPQSAFKDYTAASGINFIHKENDFVDFRSQRLLPYQLSRLGGKMAVGDVNGDGNDDVYFGGAAGQSGKLFLGRNDGTFVAGPSQPWSADAACEDMNAIFFDADNDKDLDLYVVSGGNEFLPGDSLYHDRLYINNRKGIFKKAINALPPAEVSSGSCVIAGDFDNDGDIDLFVGGRLTPKNYPITPKSSLFRNDTKDGHIVFTDIADNFKNLQFCGMVTDAKWIDIDNDNWKDLIVCGDWMPVRIFKNEKGRSFTDISERAGTINASGCWTRLLIDDFDGDGDIDILAANAGTNIQLKASVTQPMEYFVEDINGDGVLDPLISYYIQGQSYPVPSYDELMEQVPSLRKKFFKYADYAKASIHDILGDTVSPYLRVTTLQSTYFNNDGKAHFHSYPLPDNLQSSMIQAFAIDDFDSDRQKEILCAGNFYPYRVEWGKSDSFFGALLQCNSSGSIVEKPAQHLIFLMGDIRDMAYLKCKSGKKVLIVSRNNDKASIFSY